MCQTQQVFLDDNVIDPLSSCPHDCISISFFVSHWKKLEKRPCLCCNHEVNVVEVTASIGIH